MKKFKYSLLFLLIATVFIACEKEQPEVAKTDEGVITLRTDKEIGEELTIAIGAISNKVFIDWGDGNKVSVDFVKSPISLGRTNSWLPIQGKCLSNSIKIYGNIVSFQCRRSKLTAITFENANQLIALDCNQNNLKEIDLKDCNNIESLNINNNEIKSLSLKDLTKLTEIRATKNQLSEIDLRDCEDLKILLIFENKLQQLDLSKNRLLEKLQCDQNQLTELDISNNKRIKELECQKNQITKLILKGNRNLRKISCYKNKLTKQEAKNFVNSLYDRSRTSTCYFVFSAADKDDNQIDQSDIEDAKKRNWDIVPRVKS